MTRQPALEVVPPVDGLDLLVNGGEFLLVRSQDHLGERVRIGIQDSTVRVLVAMRPRADRARFHAVLACVIGAVVLAFLVPMGLGLSPLLGFSLALGVGLVGLIVALLAQPLRAYHFHDDLPDGLDRPPLMTLSERGGQHASYTLRDEQGRVIGQLRRRLGKWRIRGFEPLEAPEPASPTDGAFDGSSLAGRLYAWSVVMADDVPLPPEAAPELSLTIHRAYMSPAALVGGIIAGPIGIAMAFNGPWKRMEFRRNGQVVATGHRLDDGQAMRLEIDRAFDLGSEDDAWLDRRHLLVLAVLALSLEAER